PKLPLLPSPTLFRSRQDTHDTDLHRRATLDRAQQHISIRGAADDERGRRVPRLSVPKCAGVAKVAIGDARARQKCDLQQPIKDRSEEHTSELQSLAY